LIVRQYAKSGSGARAPQAPASTEDPAETAGVL